MDSIATFLDKYNRNFQGACSKTHCHRVQNRSYEVHFPLERDKEESHNYENPWKTL